MVVKSTITSSTVGPGLNIQSKGSDSLTKALKAAQRLYSLGSQKSKYTTEIKSIVGRLNPVLEQAVVDALGGTRIVAKTGLGFQPDFFVKLPDDSLEVREQKLVAVKEEDGKLIRTRAVGLAGGSGVQITKGTQSFLQGLKLDQEGNVVEEIATVNTTRLFNSLLKTNSSEDIKKILNGKGKAAIVLRQNLLLKAKNIDIPVTYQGQLQNRTIQFSWSDIMKNPNIKISVDSDRDSVLRIQLYFSGGLITKALNDTNKVLIRNIDDTLSKKYLQIIEEIFTLPNSANTREFKAWLKSQDYEFGISYIPGSAIISRGLVSGKLNKTPTKKRAVSETQTVISDSQFTALVQKEVEKRMPKGPLRGPPLNPIVLTYRTGTFVNSIKVVQDFRDSIITYYYAPNYRVHEKRGARAPRLLLQSSIRETVKSVYSQKFRILRGF
jgi:hypothetical protein